MVWECVIYCDDLAPVLEANVQEVEDGGSHWRGCCIGCPFSALRWPCGRSPPGRVPHWVPIGPSSRHRSEMGLVGEEYPAPGSSSGDRQSHLLRRKGLPPHWVRLAQAFGRPFQHKSQAVRVVQTTTPAHHQPEAVLHIPAHRLPVPVGRGDDCLRRQSLHKSNVFIEAMRLPALPACSTLSIPAVLRSRVIT